jgi:hypothetical protein
LQKLCIAVGISPNDVLPPKDEDAGE